MTQRDATGDRMYLEHGCLATPRSGGSPDDLKDMALNSGVLSAASDLGALGGSLVAEMSGSDNHV